MFDPELSLTNITSEQSEKGKKIIPDWHLIELFSLVKKKNYIRT